jgi:hypothetical protein
MITALIVTALIVGVVFVTAWALPQLTRDEPADRSALDVCDTPDSTVVWVCVDCYLTHHGLLTADYLGRPEPLSLLDGLDVTSGGPHGTGCPNVGPDGEWLGEDDCDCERMEFSWSPCHGCGSTLGGAREALTVSWIRVP